MGMCKTYCRLMLYLFIISLILTACDNDTDENKNTEIDNLLLKQNEQIYRRLKQRLKENTFSNEGNVIIDTLADHVRTLTNDLYDNYSKTLSQ